MGEGLATFDDHGIRFDHPDDWEVEVIDDGPRITISLQSPGSAFAFVTLDEEGPEPTEAADLALEAMRQEYPGLDAEPARETIDGREAVGSDLEFFSLDVVASCSIRCYRADRRTVLVFGQWSDLDGEGSGEAIRAIRGSIEETDGEGPSGRPDPEEADGAVG